MGQIGNSVKFIGTSMNEAGGRFGQRSAKILGANKAMVINNGLSSNFKQIQINMSPILNECRQLTEGITKGAPLPASAGVLLLSSTSLSGLGTKACCRTAAFNQGLKVGSLSVSSQVVQRRFCATSAKKKVTNQTLIEMEPGYKANFEWEDMTCNGSHPNFKCYMRFYKDSHSDKKELRYILQLESGIKVMLSSFGASITNVMMPDSNGKIDDVVLGFDTRAEYDKPENPYFGATIGRVANRVNKGEFILGKDTFQLSQNENGKHHLHGGFRGYSHQFWKFREVPNGVQFELEDQDGTEGYPGNVIASVFYSLVQNRMTGNADLKITFQGCISGGLICGNKDEMYENQTPICMTNHSYFNLAGHDSKERIYNNYLQIDSDAFCPTDSEFIPTRKIQKFDKDGPQFMDFRQPRKLGDAIKEQGLALGYTDEDMNKEINEEDGTDKEIHQNLGMVHSYCLKTDSFVPNKKRDVLDAVQGTPGTLKKFATLSHDNGRFMECSTTAPSVVLYTAQHLPDGLNGKQGAKYRHMQGLALETQTYPDAISPDSSNPEQAEFAKGKCEILTKRLPYYLHKVKYSFGCKQKKGEST